MDKNLMFSKVFLEELNKKLQIQGEACDPKEVLELSKALDRFIKEFILTKKDGNIVLINKKQVESLN